MSNKGKIISICIWAFTIIYVWVASYIFTHYNCEWALFPAILTGFALLFAGLYFPIYSDEFL